jgi:hypothetical protein
MSLDSRDEPEGMVAAQLVAAQRVDECFRRAMIPEQTGEELAAAEQHRNNVEI